MRCRYCGKQIGVLRRLRDREFCSDRHRKVGRASSARAVRDAEVYSSEDWDLIHAGIPFGVEKKQKSVTLNPLLVVPLLFIGFVALEFLPSGPAPAKNQRSGPASEGGFWQSLRNLFPGGGGVKLQSDFHSDIRDWVGAGSSAPDWSVRPGSVRPGKLRLWKPSMTLTDYRFEFQGQIENRAISWAFRAGNLENYYATKIAFTRPGPSPSADIIRYAVLNGKETNRSELPLPIQVRTETLYRVKVTVQGDFFTTSVNGQVVDTWRDNRLRTGGVGFFADKGEVATVHWVSVTERETGIFSGMFSSAFLLAPPGPAAP